VARAARSAHTQTAGLTLMPDTSAIGVSLSAPPAMPIVLVSLTGALVELRCDRYRGGNVTCAVDEAGRQLLATLADLLGVARHIDGPVLGIHHWHILGVSIGKPRCTHSRSSLKAR
jgi:hypothetical protein